MVYLQDENKSFFKNFWNVYTCRLRGGCEHLPVFFSCTRYIAVNRCIRPKFSDSGGSGCLARQGKTKRSERGCSRASGRGNVAYRSGMEVPGVLQPVESVLQFADGGDRSVSSSVRKGEPGGWSMQSARRNDRLSARYVPSRYHEPRFTPTWSIVMCSKSTSGVHCWRHARAHDLLWWPTSSMSSSLPVA